jgi:hypothetical protein
VNYDQPSIEFDFGPCPRSKKKTFRGIATLGWEDEWAGVRHSQSSSVLQSGKIRPSRPGEGRSRAMHIRRNDARHSVGSGAQVARAGVKEPIAYGRRMEYAGSISPLFTVDGEFT